MPTTLTALARYPPGVAGRVAGRVADRVADRLAWALAPRLVARLAPGQPELSAPEQREAIDNEHLALLLGYLLREDDNCIDVGANQGRFLAEMCRRAPRGRHLAWEPIPALAAQLRATFPQVDVHEAALSNRSGHSEFVLVPDDLGYSGLRERTYPGAYATERTEVKLERLDDALPEGYVPAVIKVDVEGAEQQVFEGAIETIARHQPVVVFEHGLGGSDHYGTTSDDVYNLLVGRAGLRLFDMDANGPYSRETFADIFGSGSHWNFVARP